MIYGIRRTMGKGIIPRRGKERVSMKGGGDVRLTGDERSNDGKNKTGGGAERQIVNKERRQWKKFKTRRW